MNFIEKVVYDVLKRNPRLKDNVRDIYQQLLSVIPVPSVKTNYPVTLREGYFFGFHDKCPWSFDRRYLLAHECLALRNEDPRPGQTIGLGYFHGESFGEFRRISATGAFNWQQGSMLQWIGASDRFLFNDLLEGKLVSRIMDGEGREVDVLPTPTGALTPDGTGAVSYNFPRLQRYMPGYGYAGGVDPELEVHAPKNHGISYTELASHSSHMLFSVADIAAFQPEKTMKSAHHFLTHCQFNPRGDRFIFLHRWIHDLNYLYTRMLSCDKNGKNLHVFPTADMVSHMAWRTNDSVLAYSRSVEGKDAYILFKDGSEEWNYVGTDVFTSDGHPSFAPGSDQWIVTDTYPDRFRRAFLILFDLNSGKRYNLGFFRQPLGYIDSVRCDLHPRWDRDGHILCFDSAHTGQRSLCTIDLGGALHHDSIQII